MRQIHIHRQNRCRFTPTPVGNAEPALSSLPTATVHPHACGECMPVHAALVRLLGSPPRLWGMRGWRWSRISRSRFTPTPVGNAIRTFVLHCLPPVHPHACGECVLVTSGVLQGIGSPPRLWGMPVVGRRWWPSARFTPTPVGNADFGFCFHRCIAVHPHACGECVPAAGVKVTSSGSPPRLWGMQPAAQRPAQQGRFTPTPVGNASS